MKPRLYCLTRAVAFAMAIAGLSGCDHEVATSGTAALVVNYTPSPSGAGRYDQASFEYVQFLFLPTDPELAAVLTQPLSMRFATFTVDLTATSPALYSSIALSPGTYRLERVIFRPPLLIDSNRPAIPATCIENFSIVPSGPAQSEVPTQYELDASDDITFTVQPGQTKLEIAVDIPGLISGFEESFTCLASCGGGPPCLSAFDAAAFRAQFIDNVSVR